MSATVAQQAAIDTIPAVITFINDTAANPVEIGANMLILTGQLEKALPSLVQTEVNTVASNLTSKLQSILAAAQAAVSAANTNALPPAP